MKWFDFAHRFVEVFSHPVLEDSNSWWSRTLVTSETRLHIWRNWNIGNGTLTGNSDLALQELQ
jgi:hypothetical protein